MFLCAQKKTLTFLFESKKRDFYFWKRTFENERSINNTQKPAISPFPPRDHQTNNNKQKKKAPQQRNVVLKSFQLIKKKKRTHNEEVSVCASRRLLLKVKKRGKLASFFLLCCVFFALTTLCGFGRSYDEKTCWHSDTQYTLPHFHCRQSATDAAHHLRRAGAAKLCKAP